MGENIIEIAGLRKSFDHVEVVKGVDMQVHQGEFLTLLGPSGCGKTTTLRMIAGFEEADSGHITIDGQEVTALPPYKRAVNTVFQSYALFPLMNVYDNVAYGLTVKRLPKAEIREKVTQALRTVQLEGFEKRRVSQMSGGQCQRVAIARALVNGPKVLLLDEPLGALDLKLRKQMQLELKRLQKQLGITFIYVTHDQEEAMTMSDRIAVMCAGEIQQIGTPSEIYNAPATRFVADFIGESNILPATAAAVRGDTCVYTTPMGQVLGAAAHVSEGETVYLCVRPEAVCVSAEPVSDFGIQITVTDNICTGNLIKSIGVDADGHELRFSRLAGADGFSCGETLYPYWDSAACTVIILLVSYPMAYMLSRCSRRVASNLIILMMIPYFTNSLIRLYSYITLFNTKGILTGILARLGMTWSADFLYSESAVVLGLVYVCIPYAVLPMYSSIERLDKALLEASYDLGAGRVKTFFRITLPMTMPGVYAAAIISFVPSIGNYFVADVLGGSKTLLIGNLIKDQFMSSRNWPLGSALSVFLIAGTMILVYLYARVSRADVMEGGL